MSRRRLPAISLVELPDGRRALQTSYDPRLVPGDLEGVVEASQDLANWSVANLTQETNGSGRLVVTSVVEAAAGNRNFLRYRVMQR